MNWDDTGFLLSKSRYNENSLIVEIFTKQHGKISGIIFGGTSKKIRNYLQLGNELFVNYKSKTESRIGYFKIEIYRAYTPIYFDNIKKLNCIISAINLIKLLTADSQSNYKVYDLISQFYLNLSGDSWLRDYIFWELKLLSNLGYNLDLNSMVKKEIKDNKISYIVENANEKKVVPSFLIQKDSDINDLDILLEGLKLVGNFMDKTILKPNNINFPLSRKQFVNCLKHLD